jgi:hypothetical protein
MRRRGWRRIKEDEEEDKEEGRRTRRDRMKEGGWSNPNRRLLRQGAAAVKGRV